MWKPSRLLARFGKARRRSVELRLENQIPAFYPNSKNYWNFESIAYQSADIFPSQLAALASPNIIPEVEDVSVAFPDDAQTLANTFTRYGSDKESLDYHRVYGAIFKEWGDGTGRRLLEIGIGTNDPAAISSMGANGHPGASLRAFADHLPGAQIFGADVDKNILFSEKRIATSFVDQLDYHTFSGMHRSFGSLSYDLIIDDGLHCPSANLNTVRFFTEIAELGAWIVIEDIPKRSLDVWRAVAPLLQYQGHLVRIIRTRRSHAVLIQKGGRAHLAGKPAGN